MFFEITVLTPSCLMRANAVSASPFCALLETVTIWWASFPGATTMGSLSLMKQIGEVPTCVISAGFVPVLAKVTSTSEDALVLVNGTKPRRCISTEQFRFAIPSDGITGRATFIGIVIEADVLPATPAGLALVV